MRAGAAAAVAAALLAVACSGGGSGASGGKGLTIEAVAAGTLAARTAHVEGTLSGVDNGEPVHGTFAGDADFTRHASDMNLRFSAKPKDSPESMEIRIAEGATYLRIPDDGSVEGMSFDGKFLVLPDDAFFGNSGSEPPIGASAIGFGVADPVDALRQLRALSSEVRDLGDARVDGVDTTHAQFTTKVGLLFACAKEADPAADNSNSLCEASIASRDATIDVYVDAQSRIARLETKFDAGTKVTFNSRVDYSRFGDAVDISAPPKSEVYDMSDYDAG